MYIIKAHTLQLLLMLTINGPPTAISIFVDTTKLLKNCVYYCNCLPQVHGDMNLSSDLSS